MFSIDQKSKILCLICIYKEKEEIPLPGRPDLLFLIQRL